jgi:hypothetical protein
MDIVDKTRLEIMHRIMRARGVGERFDTSNEGGVEQPATDMIH